MACSSVTMCNPCLPTFLLPIFPAGHRVNHHPDYSGNFDGPQHVYALLKRTHHQRPVIASTKEPSAKPDHFFVVLGIPPTQTTHTRNLIVSLTRGDNGFYRFEDFRMHIASRGTDIRRKVARTYMHDINAGHCGNCVCIM